MLCSTSVSITSQPATEDEVGCNTKMFGNHSFTPLPSAGTKLQRAWGTAHTGPSWCIQSLTSSSLLAGNCNSSHPLHWPTGSGMHGVASCLLTSQFLSQRLLCHCRSLLKEAHWLMVEADLPCRPLDQETCATDPSSPPPTRTYSSITDTTSISE